jgi:trehalose 6-phosphate synthase
MKSALLEAYQSGDKDLTRRMKAMRKTIRQHDVAAWADSFMAELATFSHSTHAKTVRPARRS